MIASDSRVLIVEGQARLRRLLDTMFHVSGVKTIHSVPDGKLALEILLTHPIDVVLYDWSTPGMNGVDFLRSIRSLSVTKYLPFVFMSGYGQLDDEDYAVGKDLDVDGYVYKPITHENLEDKFGSVMDQHDAMTEIFVHLSRAAAFVDVEEFQEARKELKSAREKGDRSPRVWSETGLVYEDMKRDREAKLCYEKSIQLDKNYARPYGGIGNILSKEGNSDLARKYYQKAAIVSPRSSERQYALAESLLKQGDKDGARVAVQRAVRGVRRGDSLVSSQSEESAAAAEFFLSIGQADMAEEEFGFALAGDPGNVHYFNRLGMAFRRQKKFSEAVINYKKALQVDPNNTVIHFNMALALAAMKDYTTACTTLRKALVIDMNFKDAEILLKKIQREMQKASGNGHANGHANGKH
jgi:tetratricopeptide (TPR) repeat protein